MQGSSDGAYINSNNDSSEEGEVRSHFLDHFFKISFLIAIFLPNPCSFNCKFKSIYPDPEQLVFRARSPMHVDF
jgi:hypothetical protein